METLIEKPNYESDLFQELSILMGISTNHEAVKETITSPKGNFYETMNSIKSNIIQLISEKMQETFTQTSTTTGSSKLFNRFDKFIGKDDNSKIKLKEKNPSSFIELFHENLMKSQEEKSNKMIYSLDFIKNIKESFGKIGNKYNNKSITINNVKERKPNNKYKPQQTTQNNDKTLKIDENKTNDENISNNNNENVEKLSRKTSEIQDPMTSSIIRDETLEVIVKTIEPHSDSNADNYYYKKNYNNNYKKHHYNNGNYKNKNFKGNNDNYYNNNYSNSGYENQDYEGNYKNNYHYKKNKKY